MTIVFTHQSLSTVKDGMYDKTYQNQKKTRKNDIATEDTEEEKKTITMFSNPMNASADKI